MIMAKFLSILILISGLSCKAQNSIVEDHVTIKVYPNEDENEMSTSAMPDLKADSELMDYKRRFEYLIINAPGIHQPDKIEERKKMFGLYPDTVEMKRQYLDQFIQDKKLVGYFEETLAPINNPGAERNKTYTVDELMEVASKFFYCDKVMPDTTVQAHVCVGLNGVEDANWEKDYTLLEAFCFEGIFNGFDNEDSQIWDTFTAEIEKSSQLYKDQMTSLDQYLEDVKLDLFDKMKNDEVLKKELLDYYQANETNLAFRIID